MSALPQYVQVPFAEGSQEAQILSKQHLGDWARIAGWARLTGHQRAARTVLDVLIAIRTLTRQAKGSVNKREVLEFASNRTFGKLSYRTVQRACAVLTTLGMVNGCKGRVQYLPHRHRAKFGASNVLCLPSPKPSGPKQRGTILPLAAPAREPMPAMKESELDRIDEELARLSDKQKNKSPFQPLFQPFSQPAVSKTAEREPEERKAEGNFICLKGKEMQPCASCQRRHKDEILAANPSNGVLAVMQANRARIQALIASGELGGDCSHDGREAGVRPPVKRDTPPQATCATVRGFERIGFAALLPERPKAPEPEPSPPEPAPKPIPPPAVQNPHHIMVEWKGRQLFFQAPLLRKMGIRQRDLCFAAKRLERQGCSTTGNLTGRIIGYAREEARRCEKAGLEAIPEPKTDEEAAKACAPKFFAAHGTGGRQWRIWPRGYRK